jgi:Kef-type K+ transport system membrane component KefB
MERVGQPRVVGEIFAGILLGPTLLGENLSQVIAPLQVRPVLGAIATLALILFMFLAGVEYDASRLKGRLPQATSLALLSVVVPAALGFPVGRALFGPDYAGPAADSLLPFAVFMGAALAVTAFPVMAHILMGRGELNTPLGSLAIASTGIMSIFMFTYIAFASALASGGGFGPFMLQLVWIGLFSVASWWVVRPVLGRLLPRLQGPSGPTTSGMALIFGGMVLYGLVAQLIGIHALVGGFVWGTLLPADWPLRRAVADKVRDVAMILLLPIFFALAGFSTDLKLLGPETLPAALLVLAASVAGKFLAAAPARAFGLTWAAVGSLGALFNTRGLLVLVVGLIGVQTEIITTTTFTVLVVMALVTNLMTLPVLSLLARRRPVAMVNTTV